MPTSPTEPPGDLSVRPTIAGKKTGKKTTVRVAGTVSDGVEKGCMVLTSNGVVYLLIWPPGIPVTGPEVEVEGTLRPDLMTTCQQGTPLVVDRVLSP
jgi:hypothetical protein